jgi:hypothetical protein
VLEYLEPEDRLLVRYLLGELSAEEAEPIDLRSFVDDAFAARLDAVESDLIDSFVRQELSGAALERFRSFYLASPARRQRVAFAQALLEALPATPLASAPSSARASSPGSWFTPPTWLSWALASATLLLLVGLTYLSVDNANLRKDLSASRAREAAWSKKSADQQAAQNQSPEGSAQPSLGEFKAVAMLLLPPTRGVSQLPTLTVPRGINLVALSLKLEALNFKIYRAALKDASSSQVLWNSQELSPGVESKTVSLIFPSRLLHLQTYVIELSGVRANGSSDLLASYPFRAVVE